jgi:fucose permease
VADTSKRVAAAMLSLFFIGVTLGRLAGRSLVRKVTPSHLLIMSFLVAISGFPFFWLAPWIAVRLSGLFVVGLGKATSIRPFHRSPSICCPITSMSPFRICRSPAM